MGVYDNRTRRSHEDDLALIIRDQKTTVTRTRKTHTDKMRGADTDTLGPLVVRIDGFRATRSSATFDEKGDSATAAYVLSALHRPSDDADLNWEVPRSAFKLNDILVDADGNEYRVTSPARWTGNAVEVNIELKG
jgi:hypothetical protein